MKKFQVYCISAGRADRLSFTDEELEQIHFITDKPYPVPHNTIGGGLVDSRNLALEMAFEAGLNCVQVSDDLVNIKQVIGTKYGKKVPLMQAVAALQSTAEKTSANLIGIPPTSNPLFCAKPYVTNSFIIGDAFLAKPSRPRFDVNLRLKEDYDFTAQHLSDKGTIRLQTMVWQFRHYRNAGGAVAYRNEAEEAKAVFYLMNKWPDTFRLNPTRKNEIILK